MKQRGMVKWQPFASLPEQSEYIKRLVYNMNKIPRPQLSEDQLSDLNEKLFHCFESQELVKLHYFHDGYIYLVEGSILKFDYLTQMITIENENGKRDKFTIRNVVDIELA